MFKYRNSNIACIYPKFVKLVACCFLLSIFYCSVAFSDNAPEPRPADVRLVIDVSGSMKRNDPNNLRQPAVELLVQLLPEGSKAGVWTFGKWVNMLVPHRQVDDAWRKKALAQSKKINSAGLYTNIGEALEKAVHDSSNSEQEFHTSVILLTDGMVDIDKKASVNEKEWRRIVDKVLPKLKDANYTLHTIALSDNADTNLMTKLSLATDGIAEVAHTADDLMRIFLKAFDVAAPAEQVPLSDNQFIIDSSIEEFTLLIFRETPSEQTVLVGPDKKEFNASSKDADIKWHRAAKYDLVTIKRPLEGAWLVKADMAPDSRVTVVSNLNLNVVPLPNNIIKGHKDELVLSLREDGKTIIRKEFLDLMEIKVSMEAGNDEFSLREYWNKSLKDPLQGVYKKALPVFDKDGIYQLNVVVDGKSFVRQFNHQFTVRPAFGAEVNSVFKDGNLEYQIIASGYNTDIDPASTQVVASVLAPGGRKKIIPLKATGQDTWKASLLPDKEGKYQATIKAKGENVDGETFSMELAPISFVYKAGKGFVEAEEPFFEETKQKASQGAEEKVKTEDSEAEAGAKDQPAVEQGKVEKEKAALAPWMLYAALGVGNLLLLVLGYFAYKKIMGGQAEDEVLEKFKDDKVDTSEEGAVQEKEELEEELEEEPPMEDLDIASEPASEDPSSPAEDDEDLDPIEAEVEAEPELESLLDMDEPTAEEAPTPSDAEPSDDDSSLSDDFDDLEEMAMETPEPETEVAEQPSVQPEDDELVSEMLKAQGLDLAEEELDDAISSLIDDLQGDENKG